MRSFLKPPATRRSTWRLPFGGSELITLAALLIAGIVWAVRLEGRISGQAREMELLRSSQSEAIAQVREDLSYIRARIDSAVADRRPRP